MTQNQKKHSAAQPPTETLEDKYIHRVAGYAFLLNFVLVIMKALLAIFSGSLAITASAIDSGTDAVASLVIYGGVRLSAKKTRSFPMGLYKLENLASVVIAIFIFIAGYEIIRNVFSPATDVPAISLPYILLLLVGTVATFLFGRYAMSVGRKTGSPTLVAEGRHRQVDVLSSIVVLISVVLSYFNLAFDIWGITVDKAGAALVLVFIARAGWELLSDGMRVLLDASVDPSTLNRIRSIIESEPMVSEIKSLMGRNAGRFRFIHAGITLKTENLEKAHRISKGIETRIRDEITHVERVIINYGPEEKSHYRVALPVGDGKRQISRHFGEAPYFGILRVRRRDHVIEQQRIVENPHQSVKTAKGIRVAEWLLEQGVDHVGMREDVSHKGPGYVLSNGGVRIHKISAGGIDEAAREILDKGL